ncbi:hypothetical protein D3C78_1338560 [compost metagenome]
MLCSIKYNAPRSAPIIKSSTVISFIYEGCSSPPVNISTRFFIVISYFLSIRKKSTLTDLYNYNLELRLAQLKGWGIQCTHNVHKIEMVERIGNRGVCIFLMYLVLLVQSPLPCQVLLLQWRKSTIF